MLRYLSALNCGIIMILSLSVEIASVLRRKGREYTFIRTLLCPNLITRVSTFDFVRMCAVNKANSFGPKILP